jgi:hypothetical protein
MLGGILGAFGTLLRLPVQSNVPAGPVTSAPPEQEPDADNELQ